MTSADAAAFDTTERNGSFVLAARGPWTVRNIASLDTALRAVRPAVKEAAVDLAGISELDTAGAWVIYRTLRDMQSAGTTTSLLNARDDHRLLIDAVAANDKPCQIELPTENSVIGVLRHVGEGATDVAEETFEVIGFFGRILVTLARTALRPGRLRLTSLVYHMEQVGLNAVPIAALISFLIGIVLAYQGSTQLRQLGAEVFVVDLIAVSILREIGILLTAIIIAGRSGSAFTAQIGTMKVNQEVDAMEALGLDPVELLVVPRVLALVISLPILAFISDMVGLLGGALMAWIELGISPATFLSRLNEAVSIWSFLVGMIKAPIFAFLIAMIGCFEGLKVSGSAESVGQRTTRAVVEAIFLVIVCDALFSIFFAYVGV